MVKRLIVIGLFGLLLIAPLRGKATAANCDPFLLAFYGVCIVIPPVVSGGSVCVASKIAGLKGETAERQPSYETIVFLQEGKAVFRNKGKHADVDNINFDVIEEINLASVNGNLRVKRNGIARDFTCFENFEICRALQLAGVIPSNSKKWTCEVVVTKLQAFNTAFACVDTDGITVLGDPDDPRATGCGVSDTYGQKCEAPPGVTFGDQFNYACEEVCSDGEGVTCFQPPRQGNCPNGTVFNLDTEACDAV